MKNLLFLVFFFLMGTFNAQGNLQFNQVVTLTGTLTTSPVVVGTVPAGKVWKIEHSASERNGYAAIISFVCNNVASYPYLGSTGHPPTQGHVKGPIWLKSGDYIQLINSSVSYPSHYFFSIVEFNVIP
ncbi:MAG: hypothetical protein FJZ80_04290 [Bacteroidetes bacterium]|nr:hypothetical protein [Bacteroidota bacterium]